MDIEMIFRIAFTVLSSAILTGASFKMFHIFQLSGYRMRGVLAWFRATKFDYAARYFAVAFLSFILTFVFLGCFGHFLWAYYLGFIFFIGFGAMFIVCAVSSEKKAKVPLKLTKRVWRLIIASAVLHAGVVAGLLVLGGLIPTVDYAFSALAYFLIPLTVLAAHCVMVPIEMLIQYHIKNRTRKKLSANPELIKIGITGSFGKTTAKNILTAMLEQKYRVCATPASFNTPMGIARTVSESESFASAQVFIAEMGARHVGDIAELCQIVAPRYGILTGIGSQHLETFGSVEAIAKTKYELIKSLGSDGHAFFNGDNEGAQKLFERCQTPKTLSGRDVKFKNYRQTEKGTAFTLCASGAEQEMETVLLGRHIPSLVTLCAALALELGVTLTEIAEAVRSLEAVPHRLQLIAPASDTVVIDDAYNSNPDGAKNALEVLSGFSGTRILVTPGFVEMGAEEAEANIELGRHAAQYADYAVFNSSRAQFLKQGALEAGMSADKIFVTDSLKAAMEIIKGIVAEKKVILFENDLPDNLL